MLLCAPHAGEDADDVTLLAVAVARAPVVYIGSVWYHTCGVLPACVEV